MTVLERTNIIIMKKFLGAAMRSSLLTVFIVIVALVSGCATKDLRVQEFRVAADTPDPAKPPEEYYQIGAGDCRSLTRFKSSAKRPGN